MSITRHPDDTWLLGYAAGTLDAGEELALATHLHGCAHCRNFVTATEGIGGALLAEGQAEPLSPQAFAAVRARLGEPDLAPAPEAATNPALADVPRLPSAIRRLATGRWQRVAPGLAMRSLALPAASPTRAFLLRARPGMRLMHHGHDGIELTCLLAGGFARDGAHYGPGDFDTGDGDTDHRITIDPDGVCLSLVAMRGRLELRGLVGRLIQPFISL